MPAIKAGGPIRSVANLVKQFGEADFYIFTGNAELTGEKLKGIAEKKWVQFNDHTKVWYAPKENSKLQMVKEIEFIKPDVLFMVGFYSWRFTLTPLIYGNVHRKIISVRGMLHPGALSQKSRKKRWYIRIFKMMGFPKRVLFHATDEEEKRYIKNIFGEKVHVRIAANLPTMFELQPIQAKNPGELRLVTISLISPMKNILKVLQALRSVKFGIRYQIYGAVKDEAYWEQCQKEIKSLSQNIKVEYKGVVNYEDILNCLADNQIFIMPSESENFGHSLYEALSAGRPVITSMNTPWKDLKKDNAGVNVDLESPEELTKAIEFFAGMNENKLKEWSEAAHEYAVKKLDVGEVLNDYRKMFG